VAREFSAARPGIVTAFVAAYVALGFVLPVDANGYLLLGIPITLLFQLGIRRQPVRALWLLDAPPFTFDVAFVAVTVGLAVVPAITLLQGVQQQDWMLAGYGLISMPGALAAAYALRRMNRATTGALVRCIASAGAIGIALMLLSWFLRGGPSLLPEPVPLASLRTFGFSMLQYIPAVFVLEEVLFRGAFDPYLRDSSGQRQYLSAFYLSALWGMWHVPLAFPATGWLSIPGLLGVHIAIGVPLSIWMRRSRNLAVPGMTHALIDAVRNALGAL
jgi:hypothetical protein